MSGNNLLRNWYISLLKSLVKRCIHSATNIISYSIFTDRLWWQWYLQIAGNVFYFFTLFQCQSQSRIWMLCTHCLLISWLLDKSSSPPESSFSLLAITGLYAMDYFEALCYPFNNLKSNHRTDHALFYITLQSRP